MDARAELDELACGQHRDERFECLCGPLHQECAVLERIAERGRPKVRRFETAAWNADMLAPLHPIAGSITTCDTDLPQIRFVMDADVPVIQGTRKIR